MKNIYKIFSSIFILFVLIGCAEDFSDNNEFAKKTKNQDNKNRKSCKLRTTFDP